MALLDVMQHDPGKPGPVEGNRQVDRVLAILWRDADQDPDRFRANIETWFNDSMERVSGWYKRRTQVFLLLWAAVVTIATNSDTLLIANALWRDPALRQALVQQAEAYVATQPRPGATVATLASDDAPPPPPLPPDQQAELDFAQASADYDAALADLAAMRLPIGWKDPTVAADADTSLRLLSDTGDEWPGAIWAPGGAQRWLQATRDHAIGWLLTMLAVSMGAPFWFDMLNRVVSVRSAGRAPEEAPKAPKKVPAPKEPGEEP
jgi:hypothetical protein